MKIMLKFREGEKHHVANITGLDDYHGLSRVFQKNVDEKPSATRRHYVVGNGLYEIRVGDERTYIAVVNNRRIPIETSEFRAVADLFKTWRLQLSDVYDRWITSKNRSSASYLAIAGALAAIKQSAATSTKRQMAAERRAMVATMTTDEVFDGSSGANTRMFLSRLRATSPLGKVAAALFSTQKASTRAKLYHGKNRDFAYKRKEMAIFELCVELEKVKDMVWGWGVDPDKSYAKYVLYVNLPQGQVSFHSPTKWFGPEYHGQWDEEHESEDRVIAFCDHVLGVKPVKDYIADSYVTSNISRTPPIKGNYLTTRRKRTRRRASTWTGPSHPINGSLSSTA